MRLYSKRLLYIVLIMALIFLLLVGSGCARKNDANSAANSTPPASQGEKQGSDKEQEPVVFSDAVFETLLKAELGRETIYPADLAEFTGIEIAADQFLFLSGPDRPNKSIILFAPDAFEYDSKKYTGYGTMKSLDDLKYFPKLTALRVALQPEINYNTIPNVAQLNHVSVSLSKLSDIDFLSGATNLTSVSLSTNNISDISVLENCKNLKYLYANYNNISDLSPISTLTSLKKINFYQNKLTDITPLAKLTSLEEIGMYNNSVSDISVLAGLPNLTNVEFIGNQITDVSPLKDFKSFERLALTGNPIENIELLSHIENLEY